MYCSGHFPKMYTQDRLSHSVTSNSSWPHGLWPARLLCPWDPRQGYWSGLPYPTAGDLPDPGIKPASLLHWQMGSFTTSGTWEAHSWSYTYAYDDEASRIPTQPRSFCNFPSINQRHLHASWLFLTLSGVYQHMLWAWPSEHIRDLNPSHNTLPHAHPGACTVSCSWDLL